MADRSDTDRQFSSAFDLGQRGIQPADGSMGHGMADQKVPFKAAHVSVSEFRSDIDLFIAVQSII